MASQDGKGSIILKALVVIFVVVLITVIILPGKIWQKEESTKEISRGNMATLYEAHRYYFNLKGEYTTDHEDLIATVQNDSGLIKRQLVVNHTKRLIRAMETYMDIDAIKNLHAISSNLKSIEDDFKTNKRFFITIEEIDREAEDLKLKLASFRSGMEYEKYFNAVVNLDSLWQLRRDLSDYSLQSAARLAASQANNVVTNLPMIDFSGMNGVWKPLSGRISDLMNMVNSTRLKGLTSVADRVADFQRDATDGLAFFSSSTVSFDEVTAASKELHNVYQEFLSDFLITEDYAQYTLTDTDSLLINIGDNSFYTPDNNLPYIVSFEDTAGLRVEDPTMLAEMQQRASQVAEQITQLPFMTAFDQYQAKIDALREFFPEIKAKYRRNIEITIKNKEVEGVLKEVPNSAAFDAYLKVKNFTEIVPGSDSYSEIKNLVESTLLSIGSFKQIYEDSFFGNLDTIHIDLIKQLNDYNQILSGMRRNQFTFDLHIQDLNSALEQIKSVNKESVLPSLLEIDEYLKELYLFASEGKEQSVYGIFSTRIVNYGKIFGTTGQKSWEE